MQSPVYTYLEGEYVPNGEHEERPKYTNANGCIAYYSGGMWKINAADDTEGWVYYCAGSSKALEPPLQGDKWEHFDEIGRAHV